MSLSLCPFLLLVSFLVGGSVVPIKATDNEILCGEESDCQATEKVMTVVNRIYTKLDEKFEKQATDLKELKETLDRNLASIIEQQRKLSADLGRHDERLKAHIESPGGVDNLLQSIYGAELGPRDCTDIRTMGFNVSGIYRVYPGSDTRRIETDVYCDFTVPRESWLVFQRRRDGSVNFERLWRDYEAGFGNLNGEFWLGNEKLSLLTMNRKYKLRIELEDFTGERRFAEYSTFSVRPVTDNYRLTVGGYSGNAGDSLAWHNGLGFSTKDVDNDANPNNCAQQYRGAWWYNSCHHSNLNGFYFGGSHTSFADGVEWHHWLGYYYSLKATTMKIAAVY